MANVFPKWSNRVPLKVVVGLLVVATTAVSAITYYWGPSYTRVGYMPQQPVSYSHYLHVEQLGMDCRYCHSFVDSSEHANVPNTATCMNCHNAIKTDSPLLAPVRNSYASGEAIPWVRIHQLPDYAYFNHAVHVNRGVSCVECHGQVNTMEEVWHDKKLSMQFCLECHRNPEEFLRPNEQVFDLNWTAPSPQAQVEMGRELTFEWNVNPPQSCSGCHR